jgi:hypothetical protein
MRAQTVSNLPEQPAEWSLRPAAWAAVALALLTWNGVAALYANPLTLLHSYDGPQYQLLARNRLHGHYEVGDTAHTVGGEGAHPMWRPGLVWLTEGLARCLGSVRAGAAAAGALGATLLELALLGLAWRCFGRATFALVLVFLFAPFTVNAIFLHLALGQAPETWAAAALVAGVLLLGQGRQRSSWAWAVGGGAMAGLAEWFRTGNVLLFAVPCAVYGLAALRRRGWREAGLSAASLAAFVGASAAGGLLVPTALPKTLVNLRANLMEQAGPILTWESPERGLERTSVGGLLLAPGTAETQIDYLVRSARGQSTLEFAADSADVLLDLYEDRLWEVLTGAAWGLRRLAGEVVLACFALGLLLCLVRPDARTADTLACGAAALAQYLGPVTLLVGDSPSVYHLVFLPFLVLVAARGAARVGELAWAALRTWQPGPAARLGQTRGFALVLAAAPLACLALAYYLDALSLGADYARRAAAEQAALDALHLEGGLVACRTMGWFVDRDVRIVLLPYATVPELERYCRARGITGILLWENEPELFARATPCGTLADLECALTTSSGFAAPRVSGAWRWYPLASEIARAGRPGNR